MSDLSDLIRNIKATHGKTPAFEMHGLLFECLSAFETLQRENEALKHDIARHAAIASEEATRADGLQSEREITDLEILCGINAANKTEHKRGSFHWLKVFYAAIQSGSKP